MLSGIYHVQEDTDRNGRVILHWFNKSVPYVTSKTIVRTPFALGGALPSYLWYISVRSPAIFSSPLQIRINYYIWFNILIPIHSVQKKGLLVVFYDVRKTEDPQVDSGKPYLMQIFKFMSCVPIRYSGLHFCLKMREGNLAWNRLFLDIAMKAAPKYARERACVHYGSDVELRYRLANYGIPLDTFPVDVNGNIRESILNTWLHNHLAKEGSLKSHGSAIQDNSFPGDDDTSSSSGDDEDAPSSSVQDGIWQTDVLLGRGRLVQYHPGNIRFRELLEEHRAEYESLLRNQRRQACIDLTNELVGNGTRFLKHGENGEWTVCCFEDAVGKVSQFYRTRRRRTREDGHV